MARDKNPKQPVKIYLPWKGNTDPEHIKGGL